MKDSAPSGMEIGTGSGFLNPFRALTPGAGKAIMSIKFIRTAFEGAGGGAAMKYTIANDRLTAVFDTMGAQMNSLKTREGTEYLWQGNPEYWKGQAPVLFPIVGNLRKKRASIGGNRTCHMEQHGVVRHMEFRLVNREADSIIFSVCSNEWTRNQYPYDFELQIRYALKKTSIVTEYTVKNPNQEVLPFQIGGHPAFNCPLEGDGRFEDYRVEFELPETADCPTIDPETRLLDMDRRIPLLRGERSFQLNRGFFQTDALVFDRLKSRRVKLYNPASGHGVQMNFSDFRYLLVWSSSNGGPFIALEPWSGLPTCSDEGDVFEQKRGVCLLPPGREAKRSFEVSVF